LRSARLPPPRRETFLRNGRFRHKRLLIYNAIRSLTLMDSAAALFSFLAKSFAFLDFWFAVDGR
jgi:hypothetical protein